MPFELGVPDTEVGHTTLATHDVVGPVTTKGAAMGKKGKKGQAGKPKKLTPKDVGKRLNALAKKVEEELEGADLFAPLLPTEDCAICLVPLSRLSSQKFYQACCGNEICKACCIENEESINKQNEKNADNKDKKPIPFSCPFCREPNPPGLEYLRQLHARGLQNDHKAFTLAGEIYRVGGRAGEIPKDELKALDCWIQAIELGSPEACVDIGNIYDHGNGVAVDKGKAALFYRMGALRGDIAAHHNIGFAEYNIFGNHEIGIRHWKIAAEAGSQVSLDALKKIYNADGKKPAKKFISKECMDSLYRACHAFQEGVKSEEREKHCTDDVAANMKC